MRPGSLTKQSQKRPKTGVVVESWQLSYTHKMKSRTEYVRKDRVEETREQVEEYRRFKKLIEEWIDLSIEQAKFSAKDE